MMLHELQEQVPPIIWNKVLNLYDGLDCYKDSLINTNSLETLGDIGDLFKYLSRAYNNEYEESINKLCVMVEFLYHSEPMGFQEIRDIPTIKIFRRDYPNLFQTIQVWIWS